MPSILVGIAAAELRACRVVVSGAAGLDERLQLLAASRWETGAATQSS